MAPMSYLMSVNCDMKKGHRAAYFEMPEIGEAERQFFRDRDDCNRFGTNLKHIF